MIQTLFNKGSIPVLEKIIHFTKARHNMLAHNIANLNTPNYKAKDAPLREFTQYLLDAYQRAEQMRVPVFEFQDTNHVKTKDTGGLKIQPVLAKEKTVLKHNGNNVSVENEMVKLLKNMGLHSFMTSLLTQQYGMLRTAITERFVG
jgi:flagellar basal-body rod protein FlgB